MRLVARFSSLVSHRFRTSFSSKDTRFRLAVTFGFMIAAVGFLTVVAGDRTGSAQGFLESLFGGRVFDQPQVFEQPQVAMRGRPIPAPYRHVARRAVSEHAGVRVRAVKFGRRSGEDRAGPALAETSTGSGQSVCVRLCDGFAFPVGAYHGAGDRAAHEATCHAQCPGAETALFLLPSGSETITDAVNARTRRAYSALPDAFHYTTVLDEACSCHPTAGNRVESLLRDFTLRRGDAVMTTRGIKVFHGAAQYPFRRRDFLALDESRDVRRDARATFKAIERASLRAPSTLVADKPSRAPAVSINTGTRQLEHQASR